MKRGRISSATDSNSKRVRKEKAKISSFSKCYRFQLIIKRGWISKTTRKRKGKGKVIRKKSTHEYSGPNLFSDLPRDILLNILLRLPVKRILVSKSVCKVWYELISDHEFAKLYSDQADSCPLIQRSRSRMIYLVQPDKADFELKLGMSCDHSSFKPGCVCNVHVKLDAIFEIPKRSENEGYEYGIVNSCNGLLCLYNIYANKDHHIVCNPITGEFITVPPTKDDSYYNSGFGFSPETNQYKVIWMYQPGKYLPQNGVGIMAEVHIIGTKTWRQIRCCIKSMPESYPIYMNGFLYWTSFDGRSLSLISFDIASECFDLVLGPTTDECYISDSDSMVVLGGELCISAVLKSRIIRFWSMKDYGTEKAWSNVFSFDLNCFQLRNNGLFEPIKYLNDGALLMFSYHTNVFVYADPKTNRMRSLNVRGCGADGDDVEPIAQLIPSFVSLKRALSGHNVKVHNVKSRSVQLKLQGEAKYHMHLIEEEFYGYF